MARRLGAMGAMGVVRNLDSRRSIDVRWTHISPSDLCPKAVDGRIFVRREVDESSDGKRLLFLIRLLASPPSFVRALHFPHHLLTRSPSFSYATHTPSLCPPLPLTKTNSYLVHPPAPPSTSHLHSTLPFFSATPSPLPTPQPS